MAIRYWLPVQAFLIVMVLVVQPCFAREEKQLPMAPFSVAVTPSLKLIDPSSSSLLGTTLSSGISNNVFSEPPTLAGRYIWNGSTVIPYIGLGFGGGETTDMTRTITRQSALQNSIQQDRLMSDVLGKTLVPNEFQLGVRIPF